MKITRGLLVALLLAGTSMGATLHVPGDQPTIQAGIDAAGVGDTVLVAADTYTGPGNRDIDFGGKNVSLISESGAEVTTIDCQGSESKPLLAFSFHSDEDSTCLVEGFTITGAWLVDTNDDSAAVYCSQASPALRNCVITGNSCGGIRSAFDANPHVEDCVISNNDGHGVHVAHMLVPLAGIKVLNTLIANNTGNGVFLRSAWNAELTNCTMVGNGGGGFVTEGDPPKLGEPKNAVIIVSNCISAYNQGAGFQRVLLPQPQFFCNDAWGNAEADWQTVFSYPGDTDGNLALPPLFCDYDSGDYTIHGDSPCAPANNSCVALIGASEVGCYDVLCGDVNGNGSTLTVTDLVYLMRYILGQAPPIAPWENADLDHCSNVNVADLARYVDYMTSPPPEQLCTPVSPCYQEAGGNNVALGCPAAASVEEDSVALPVYITNDQSLTALSLGFHYNSDLIWPLRLSREGSVLPEDWSLEWSYPGDTAFFWPVADSNIVLLVASNQLSTPDDPLEVQSGGLLATLWFETALAPGSYAEYIDVDSIFVPPAGEFIFAPVGGGAIRPSYSDCGTSDIIAYEPCMCGDADGNGYWNIADAICLIGLVFPEFSCLNGRLCQADADGNNIINIADAVYLIGYIFGGGRPPGGCAQY